MKKTILVTGGAGFIGRALLKKLLRETDHHLYVVDNLSSSMHGDGFLNNERITFEQADLSDWEPPEDLQVDQIYHLAGPVGPVRVLDYAGRIAQLIVGHLYKIADFAIEQNAKLIFISTSEVYGSNAKSGTPESQHSVIPSKITARLEYGTAKLIGEIILKNLSTNTSLKHNCVRPFNIVGPGQSGKGGFVIPRFVEMALKHEPITVYGDGKMVRAFTHVQDFVDAIYEIMESDVSGEVINIGHPGNTITISELAHQIKDVIGSKSEIKLVNPKDLFGQSFEDAWDKIPDISKITELTNWEPRKNLHDIIVETVEHMSENSSSKTQDFSI